MSVLETDASVYMCIDVKSCHYEPGTTSGFSASGGEECNPGPETRLDCAEPSCDQVLLKYKRDREASDIDIRRGQKERPLASFQQEVIYLLASC